MPNAQTHRRITRQAIKNLPAWERKYFSRPIKKFLDTACEFPDLYFGLGKNGGHERALPYAFFTDGIQFHYLPDTPIAQEYRYYHVQKNRHGVPQRLEKMPPAPNENWRHARRGFHYYLSRAVKTAREENWESFAGYVGTLFHVLQDYGNMLHSLEGPDGTDFFVLDRLLGSDTEDLSKSPSWILTRNYSIRFTSGMPKLLGTSVDEAVFLLYTRHYLSAASARRKLIPLYELACKGKYSKVSKLASEMANDSAILCSDVFHTVLSIAFDRFEESELKPLRQIFLSDIKPVREPLGLSSPYRFATKLNDAALDLKMKRQPLKLRFFENGQTRTQVFKKGFGTGSHFEYRICWEIPPSVYSRFRTAVGLHAELGRSGEIEVEIRFRGIKVFEKTFTGKHSAGWADCSTISGGLLEWIVRSPKGPSSKNNIVWGDPILGKVIPSKCGWKNR